MRRLRQNMQCSLVVEDATIACLVVGVHRESVLLAPMSARRFHMLAGQTRRAELSFHDRRGALVMLSGVVVIDQRHQELRFVVTDGVQVPEPRGTLRVWTRVDATVTARHDDGSASGPSVVTPTVELSSTGMTLRDAPALDGGVSFDVELPLPDEREEPLRMHFVALRRGPGTLHGRLEGTPQEQLRLETWLLSLRRTETRREIARHTHRDVA
jgi:hypothetical protein